MKPAAPVVAVVDAPEWRAEVKVPRQAVVFFTRHLATMLQNGVGVVDALECLTIQEDAPNFGVVIQAVMHDLETGKSLSESAKDFPGVFPSLYVQMTRVGESTGLYASTLNRAADWMERDLEIRRRVKGALTYPVLVLLVSLLLTMSIFTFVLPRFSEIFLSLGVPLPVLTQVIMLLTRVVSNPGSWIFLVFALPVGYYSIREALAHRSNQIRVFALLLKVPIVGRILHLASLTRFCAAANSCLGSGLDLIGTFTMASQASGNPLIIDNIGQFVNDLSSGFSLTQHLESHRELYNPVLISLVSAGEESATLEDMMSRAEPYFDEEVKHLVEMLSAALEPILLLGTGLMVGVILLSIFLPMYSYLAVLH